jgi:beta,beta-carotene 9',10'-dioxygenase
MAIPPGVGPAKTPDVGYWAGFETADVELEAVELPVRGTFPAWLTGELVRNGPGTFEAGENSFRHWFDGLAMLHRFAFADGRVQYSNRYLETAGLQAAREGRIDFSEFATDPCGAIFSRFFARMQWGRTGAVTTSGNAPINVATMGGAQFALTETPIAVRFDPETLATVGVTDYSDDLQGQLTTAHPHRVPGTGDLVNYLLNFGPRNTYQVYRQRSGSMTRELVASVPVRHPGYLHSFGVTEDHVVLAVYPYVVNAVKLLLWTRPFIENYRWRPELGARFIVVSLADGSVRDIGGVEPFFAFHHVNSYTDENGEIVVDLCAYPDPSVIDAFYLGRLSAGEPLKPSPRVTRYRIDAGRGTVTSRVLSEQPLELPRIAYDSHNGRPYRYVYGVGDRHRDGSDFFNQLVKMDVETGESLIWDEPGCYPSEPVFVPAPEASGEDDGVVLSVILDGATNQSFLLALDAATWQELARAEVPIVVPHGFHGQFLQR